MVKNVISNINEKLHNKKALINSKNYGLLGICDLKKINNWEETKCKSLSINTALEEQKEK